MRELRDETDMELTWSWTWQMAPERIEGRSDGEAQLVAAAVGGDRDAFTRLVRLHERRVFRLAGRFFRQRADVEDAAQETFLTAWRKRHTYRGEAPFEHWLTRVCLNCCYDKLRHARPEQPLEAVPEPGSGGGDPDAGLEVERLFARLDPKDRFLLLLLDGEGWSTAEIAAKLGWSRANVKVRAHRARRKLRQVLERGLE